MAVVPLLLLLIALSGLRAAFGGAYGRLGNAGFLVSFVELALAFAGNGVEFASLTFSGSESSLGHSLFLIGFLILLLGSVLLGVAPVRTRRDAASRLAEVLLALALPLGILLAVVLGTLAPRRSTSRSCWPPSGPHGPTPSTRGRASTRCSISRARA